jgi:acyl-CoA thioesterase FadM
MLGTVTDTWHFVLARVAIDYKQELTQDDERVLVRCSLASVGRASIRTREEIVRRDGSLSAVAESVIVPRDPATLRSRPLTEDERGALERDAAPSG